MKNIILLLIFCNLCFGAEQKDFDVSNIKTTVKNIEGRQMMIDTKLNDILTELKSRNYRKLTQWIVVKDLNSDNIAKELNELTKRYGSPIKVIQVSNYTFLVEVYIQQPKNNDNMYY